MPDERNYYVICDDNCKFPSMTAEQIMAAIAEATGETPTHIDEAFITKIREQHANGNLKFWVGTQAQYNADEPDAGTFCIITDSVDRVEELNGLVNQYLAQISANTAAIAKLKEFTFVVDSDAALEAWRSKAAGNDYSKVYIKSGTYQNNYNSLSLDGTHYVKGENGAVIKIGLSNGLTNKCEVYNVTVELSRTSNACFANIDRIENCTANINNEDYQYRANAAIYNCKNIKNCKVNIIQKSSEAYGFYKCEKLYNCEAIVKTINYNNAIGFMDCEKLIYCTGSAEAPQGYDAYGFERCSGVFMCSGSFDTTSCFAKNAEYADYDATYAVANTANGGFNNLT